MLSTREFELLARRRPPGEALAWVERAVGRGARFVSARRLGGGTSTAVHAVDVNDRRGRRHHLVLRRFIRPNWQGPELPRVEATALQLLEGTAVPAPRCVAFDAEAAFCDVPALLMTRLAGRVELRPADMDDWLTKLAAPLPALHEVGGSAKLPAYRPYTKPAEFTRPQWARRRTAWRKLLGLARGPAPATPRRFIHRDYHPTNVLWSRGEISGVIDWVNASKGPQEIDVAHCRVNLVALYGVDAADQFLEAYCYTAGLSSTAWHPYWDALCVLDSGLATEPHVFPGWKSIGPRLTAGLLRDRFEDFAAAIAARC